MSGGGCRRGRSSLLHFARGCPAASGMADPVRVPAALGTAGPPSQLLHSYHALYTGVLHTPFPSRVPLVIALAMEDVC